jgi:hypothetical protein
MIATGERKALVAARRAALDAAAAAIVRSVPDLHNLVTDLEQAGGSARLVAALRERLPARLNNGGIRGQPSPAIWSAASNGRKWR